MRKLKFHERKLLKKVDFVNWKHERGIREATVIRKYCVQRREDYIKYMRICGEITSLISKLKKLDPTDEFRIQITEQLLNKLYLMGLIPTQKSLALCDRLSVSSFCRRRIPVVCVRLKMAPRVRDAVTFVEQGHIRVGPEVITDPAMLVTRAMEDYVTWVDSSKIKRKVLKYRDQVDDYDLMS